MMRHRWHESRCRARRSFEIAARLSLAGLSLILLLWPGWTRGARGHAGQADAAADPWSSAQVVQPADLVKQLAGPADARPSVVSVGFDFLYQAAHIPGSVFYGPARESSGLQRLKTAAHDWPRDREVVIYCGCCPFRQCPNVRPAFTALKEMGFTRLRVLYIDHDLRTDWLRQGYPVEKSPPPAK